MPKPKVRVRMYRPGLGDCFLLTFKSGAKSSHILIDCGLFVGTPNEKSRITSIAEHVVETTGGRVNALAATHEHWDHVAGFFHAQQSFEKLKADEVWLAWTEDPDQTTAKENKKAIAAGTRAVGLAVQRMNGAASPVDREIGLAASQVLGFEGLGGDQLAVAAFSPRTDSAMDFVSSKKKASQPFLKPGEVLERAWLPGVRVYVLGPPQDLKALKNMSGTASETFEGKEGHGAAMAWMAAVLQSAPDAAVAGPEQSMYDETAERLRPFDEALAWPEADSISLSSRFGELYTNYRAEQWRTIDNDWLHTAANLALQVDNAINNTSLVLAFELTDSGEVLLFVGDAQVGNWKSWIEMEFTVKEGGAKMKVTARDLLERTVFYKVGHHGSGNATLRAGLEAMTSQELVAAIPTDEVFAKEKQGWEMPARKLKPALAEKTKGRILRADPGKPAIPETQPEGISKAAWTRFVKRVTAQEPLYVDYEL